MRSHLNFGFTVNPQSSVITETAFLPTRTWISCSSLSTTECLFEGDYRVLEEFNRVNINYLLLNLLSLEVYWYCYTCLLEDFLAVNKAGYCFSYYTFHIFTKLFSKVTVTKEWNEKMIFCIFVNQNLSSWRSTSYCFLPFSSWLKRVRRSWCT